MIFAVTSCSSIKSNHAPQKASAEINPQFSTRRGEFTVKLSLAFTLIYVYHRYVLKKIKHRNFLFGSIFLLFLIITPSLTKASPSNNPIFATIEKVQQMIADALAPIQLSLNNLVGRTANLENQVANLQTQNASFSAEIADLQQRVTALENPPQPKILLSDDFNGPSLNTNAWEFFSTNGGNYSFDNGSIVVPGGSSMFYIRSKNNPFPTSGPFTVEFGIQYTTVDESGIGVALGFEQQNGYDQSNIPVSYWQDHNGLVVSRFGLTVATMGGVDTNYHIGKIVYDGTKYQVFLDGVLKYTSPSSATAKSLWFGNPFCCRSNWTGFKLDYIKVTQP